MQVLGFSLNWQFFAVCYFFHISKNWTIWLLKNPQFSNDQKVPWWHVRISQCRHKNAERDCFALKNNEPDFLPLWNILVIVWDVIFSLWKMWKWTFKFKRTCLSTVPINEQLVCVMLWDYLHSHIRLSNRLADILLDLKFFSVT